MNAVITFLRNILSRFDALKTSRKILVFLLLIFPFRLAFGLHSEFWFEDEMQVYLIGLKYYCTGLWPYYGPDVVYTHTQIPGALQGLLTGLPFFLFPSPEAPYILLNILSFGALSLLAWYCSKRVPAMPAWIIWLWIFTCPWTMNFSTHVTNPSYVLSGGILFFIALLEIIPTLSMKLLSPKLSFFMLGISFFWVMQLHMSWTVLLPFIAFAFYLTIKKDSSGILMLLSFFITGSLISGSLLIPTLLHPADTGSTGGTASNIHFEAKNLLSLFTVIVRFLSFSTFEISRFIGAGTKDRIAFGQHHLWVIPFLITGAVTGLAQVAIQVIEFFKTKKYPQWKELKFFVLASCLLLYGGFIFSIKGPASHTFYVFLPLSMIYFFHSMERYAEKKLFRQFAFLFLVSGMLVHVAILQDEEIKQSMYTKKNVPEEAIQKKEYHILGKRRSEDWGCCY